MNTNKYSLLHFYQCNLQPCVDKCTIIYHLYKLLVITRIVYKYYVAIFLVVKHRPWLRVIVIK